MGRKFIVEEVAEGGGIGCGGIIFLGLLAMVALRACVG